MLTSSRTDVGYRPAIPCNGAVAETTVTLNTTPETELTLDSLVPKELMEFARQAGQKAIPAIAKDAQMLEAIEYAIRRVSTRHKLILGDSRLMQGIGDAGVQLVLTSPPYWTLKKYPVQEGQLGLVEDYEVFLEELDKVWRNAFRVLAPGGRLIIVVGDVCLSRRRHGRHVVYPLHASLVSLK